MVILYCVIWNDISWHQKWCDIKNDVTQLCSDESHAAVFGALVWCDLVFYEIICCGITQWCDAILYWCQNHLAILSDTNREMCWTALAWLRFWSCRVRVVQQNAKGCKSVPGYGSGPAGFRLAPLEHVLKCRCDVC